MPKTAPPPDPLAAIVDELGDLDEKLKPWTPAIARQKFLRETLRESCADLSPEKETTIDGSRWRAWIGSRGIVRAVNVKKLLKLLTVRSFAAVVDCSISALEKHEVDPVIVAQVVEAAPTGYRPLKVYAKA
jgi:hypothetical protein